MSTRKLTLEEDRDLVLLREKKARKLAAMWIREKLATSSVLPAYVPHLQALADELAGDAPKGGA